MIIKVEKIPNDLFNKLKKVVKDKSIEANKGLAGNIKEEYSLDKYIPLIEKFLFKVLKDNPKLLESIKYRYDCNSEDRPIKLKSFWVNYQKKNEFNPIHNHRGVLSFIIFMKIPFLSKDQLKIAPGKKSCENLPGVVQFINFDYLTTLRTENFFVDKTWEQSMLIFPASYPHCVYPFYDVNEYRITLSGNLKIEV